MLTNLENAVRSNKHLKEGQIAVFYRETDDNISAYIDIIKYGFLRSSRNQVSPDFRQEFNELGLDDQMTLSRHDHTFSLLAIVLERLMYEGFPKDQDFSEGNAQLAIDAGVAINIVNRNLAGIPSEPGLLYRYFVNAEIKPEEAQKFQDTAFQSSLLSKLINEERVLFTWIVKNLIVLIRAGSLNAEIHSDFFIKLFKRESYIHGEQQEMFHIVMMRCHKVAEGLVTLRLLIDPFSKQTNHSTWLNHVQKYLFLIKSVSELEQQIELPPAVKVFLKRHAYFLDMYEHDRFISSELGSGKGADCTFF